MTHKTITPPPNSRIGRISERIKPAILFFLFTIGCNAVAQNTGTCSDWYGIRSMANLPSGIGPDYKYCKWLNHVDYELFCEVSPSGHNIYYNIITDSTVEVTYKYWLGDIHLGGPTGSLRPTDSSYPMDSLVGDVVIPSQVTHNGITYSVVSVGPYAFLLAEEGQTTSITFSEGIKYFGMSAIWEDRPSSLQHIYLPNSLEAGNETTFDGVGDGAWLHFNKTIYELLQVSGLGFWISHNKRAFVKDESGNEYLMDHLDFTLRNIDEPIANDCYLSFFVRYGQDGHVFNKIHIYPDLLDSIPHYFQRLLGKADTIVYHGTLAEYCSSEYAKYKSGHVFIVDGMELTGDLVIPDGVTTLSDDAFNGCGLTSVSMPSSIRHIGSGAFANNPNLTVMNIQEGVSYIGVGAFQGSAITTLTLPSTLDTLGNDAFRDCSSLTTVYYNVDSLKSGSNSFYGDSALANVVVGNNVKYFPGSLFANCPNLTSLTVGSELRKMTLPSSIANLYYTGTLLDWCNNNLDNERAKLWIGGDTIGPELVIPEGATRCGTFRGVTIRSLSIPSTATTGINCNLDSLQTLHFNAKSMTGLGIFGRKKSLTELTIGDSVRNIPEICFYLDSGVVDVFIPATVESIGNGAFQEVNHIEYHGNASGAPWGARSMNGYREGRLVYEDSTRTGLIYCCPDEDTVLWLPQSVNRVYSRAFIHANVKELHIPSSTVFRHLELDGVDHVFYSGEQNGYVYTSGARRYNYEQDGVIYADSGHTVVWYSKPDISGTVALREGVKKIMPYSFYQRTNITGLILPSSVDTIGNHAFDECSNLNSISLGSGLRYIGDEAFYGTLSAFSDTLVIPDNVETIGANVFRGNYSVLVLGHSLRTVGRSAFGGNGSLQATIFTGTITEWMSIDWQLPNNNSTFTNPTDRSHNLFIGGEELTHLVIPEGVTEVKPRAFSGLTNLHAVTFPASVQSIGTYAFYGCSLDTVYALGTVAPTNGGWSNCVHVIPCKSLQSYQQRWGSYRTFLFDYPDLTISTSSGDIVMGTTTIVQDVDCDTNATVQAIPSEHYHFVRWSDGSTDNPYTIHLATDTLVTAFFAIDRHVVRSDVDTLKCIVEGTGEYNYGSPVTLYFRPRYGYTLQGLDSMSTWGVYDYGEQTYVTAFSSQQCWGRYLIDSTGVLKAWFTLQKDVNLQPIINNSYMTVDLNTSGYGSIYVKDHNTHYLDNITIVAAPAQGQRFMGWTDNVTDNPRSFTLTQDTSFTATFAGAETIEIHDTTYIDVPYAVHDTTYVDVPYTVHDTTYVDVLYAVHDTTYVDIHDTTYVDVPYAVHDTTYVDIHDTTYVDIHDTTIITDTLWLTQYDSLWLYDTTYILDTTYIDVPYAVHDTAYFDIHDTTIVIDTLWLTLYDTVWQYDTIVVHDTVYITQDNIDGVETANVKIYFQQGQLIVDGAEGSMVTLYDVFGRKLVAKRDEYTPLRFDVPASGTYLIKIGDHPARRVVVIR